MATISLSRAVNGTRNRLAALLAKNTAQQAALSLFIGSRALVIHSKRLMATIDMATITPLER